VPGFVSKKRLKGRRRQSAPKHITEFFGCRLAHMGFNIFRDCPEAGFQGYQDALDLAFGDALSLPA
jgi:hypothetical protein